MNLIRRQTRGTASFEFIRDSNKILSKIHNLPGPKSVLSGYPERGLHGNIYKATKTKSGSELCKVMDKSHLFP